jgi:hypothetical protein
MTTSQQEEKIGQVNQLTEVGKSNLEKNAELWRAESIFVKLEDGENKPTVGISLFCVDCHKQMGSILLPGASIPKTQEIIEAFKKVSISPICLACAERRQMLTLK